VEQLVGRLQQFWAGLSMWQKVIVGGLPALLIIAALASIVLVIAAPPVKAPLYRNLETADAAGIVEELKKENVEYTLENEGRDILVPAAKVYELRLSMATMGLPKRNVGFELFDKTKLGVTEQGMRIDYQRALQGELARTLESLEPVERASVLLNISPETSFLDVDTHSTASVSLKLKAGAQLSEVQVEGVRHLVANAVPRLAKDDVSIVDGSGMPLAERAGDATSAQQLMGMQLTDLQQRFRGRVERGLEDKIRTLLEGPYGAGNVSPSVTVDIDFRAIHNESETYTPVNGDQGIEKRVEEHREKTTGGTVTQGGVPGSTSNIPGYLGISGGAQGEQKEQSKYDMLVDYLVNKNVSLEDVPPGAITKRSASVAISTDTWDAATEQKVGALIAGAIGADATKGDAVTVQAFQFSEAAKEAVTQQYVRQQRARSLGKLAGWAAALLMVVILALVLRSIVTTAFPSEALALAGVGAPEARARPGAEEAEEFALKRLDEVGATAQTRMRQEISRLIDSRPEQVVQLVRSWMLEDQ